MKMERYAMAAFDLFFSEIKMAEPQIASIIYDNDTPLG